MDAKGGKPKRLMDRAWAFALGVWGFISVLATIGGVTGYSLREPPAVLAKPGLWRGAWAIVWWPIPAWVFALALLAILSLGRLVMRERARRPAVASPASEADRPPPLGRSRPEAAEIEEAPAPPFDRSAYTSDDVPFRVEVTRNEPRVDTLRVRWSWAGDKLDGLSYECPACPGDLEFTPQRSETAILASCAECGWRGVIHEVPWEMGSRVARVIYSRCKARGRTIDGK